MNTTILLKLLESLVVVTDNNVSGYALGLKQAVEITLKSDINATPEMNRILTQSVLCDWDTFNQIAALVDSVKQHA